MRKIGKARKNRQAVLSSAIQAVSGTANTEDSLSDEDPFRDFIEENRQAFREIAPTVPPSGKQLDGPQDKPTRFEDASICVDCRHYMELETYSNIVIDDPQSSGGRRNMLVTMRRCLLGAIKLPSVDESISGDSQIMRGLGVQAPIAFRCNKFSPYTDEELDIREARMSQFAERQQQKKDDQIALEAARIALEAERQKKSESGESKENWPQGAI